ncbi:undecaprenyl diphosphate synthase family protein-like protein [Corynespora cassiicola Philippines]|uniref:Alkyl transferase n=1 Tax=Corynespora cassiicola Philippines TaxID=1448308 RepID=A0A2T2N7Q9_CORCC|nr:undecaprenyl diphosphate synthase family protein-like protein [Corynespora cassiicola Philippines]
MDSRHSSRIHKWIGSFPPIVWTTRQLRELLIGALRQGPVPQHIAFVMDGNRRYARSHHIESIEGHNLGFEALARILEICYKTGVKVVTIYAFSIENFKRKKYEVDALMEMAKMKLNQLSEHGALLDRYGASIRVIGNRTMVRKDVQEAIDRAEGMTAHNKKAILNVCFPYTSRDEITSAVKATVNAFSKPIDGPLTPSRRTFSESHITQNIRKQMLGSDNDEAPEQPASRAASPSSNQGQTAEDSSATSTAINPQDKDEAHGTEPNYLDYESISVHDLDNNMYTAGMPPLDLLIRTSGVQRLSDFMLWQCHEDTSIKFIECNWPEFDLWNFLPVLVEWQWQRKKLQEQQVGRGRSKSD